MTSAFLLVQCLRLMEGLGLKANVKWAKFCILTWNCRMLARRHLLAATSSTRMMWMEDARALWRAAMSVSENTRCHHQSLNRQKYIFLNGWAHGKITRVLRCSWPAHMEDLVGHGKCQLGKVKDGVMVATTTKEENKNCSAPLVLVCYGKQNLLISESSSWQIMLQLSWKLFNTSNFCTCWNATTAVYL